MITSPYFSDPIDIFAGDDLNEQIRRLTSPQSAQSLVSPPPNSPAPGAAGQSTQRTGNLAMAPQQAQPKRSGPDMLPGRAALPETISQNSNSSGAPLMSASSPVQSMPVPKPDSRKVVFRDMNGLVAGAGLKTAPALRPASSSAPNAGVASGLSVQSPQAGSAATAAPYQPGVPLATQQGQRMQAYSASPPGMPSSAPAPLMPAGMGSGSSMPLMPAGQSRQVQPDKLNLQTQQDQDRLNYLRNSGSGISQIKNPVGRVAATAGDIALRMLAPGIEPFVGGTEGRHQLLLGQQQGAVANDQAQQLQAAQQADVASQTAERTQKANLDLANAGKAERFDPNAAKTVETGDGVFQLNPDTGKYDIRIGSPKDKTPEGERPLGSTIPNLNKTLQDRYQVLHPGQSLPSQYTLPATATQKDYERIDKALGGVEGAEGTHQQQQQTLALRQQALAATEAARAAGGSAALDRETARFAKPYEKANEAASAQLEKIDDAANMIGGSAEAQALGIPKVLTALVGGQGTGVRITTPELNAIASARGWIGDFQGTLNSISGKGKLTSTQQQQLKQILNDVKTRITQKRQIANDALDKINGGATREDVIAADKEARQRLTDLESGKSGSAKTSTSGGFNWDVHPKVNP